MISNHKTWWAALAIGAALTGCDTPAPPSPVVPPGPSEPAGKPAEAKPAATKPEMKAEMKADEKKVDAKDVKLSDAEVAEIKKLPEADQKLALAQKVCPVSNEPLGGMGVPIKLTLKDKPVFICCAGCKKDAEANPDATLAKLGK